MCELIVDGKLIPHTHDRFEAPSHGKHKVIAVVGKGGVGKTAFTAMFAGVCSKSASCGKVLVIDADPALGLALALGIEVKRTIGEVREEIINTVQKGDVEAKSELASKLDYLIFESMIEFDNYAFIAMGRSDSLGCYCSVNDLLRDAIQILAQEFDTVIIDGEAGLEQLNRQVLTNVDDLIILTDGSERGLHTVKTLREIAHEENLVDENSIGVVFNRSLVSDDVLRQSIEKVSTAYLGTVPLDSQVAEFDAIGRPLIELPIDSSASHSVWHIAERIFAKNK